MTSAASRSSALAVLGAVLLALAVLTGCSAGFGDKGVRFSSSSSASVESEAAVTLEAPRGFTVAYTTDGRVPTEQDDTGLSQVEVPLTVERPGNLASHADLLAHPDSPSVLLEDPNLPGGVVLRAATVDESGSVGEPRTEVYFPNVDFAERFPGCLVVSIVTDPENLLDYETGILVPGKIYDEWVQTEEAQEVISSQATWDYQTNSTQHGRDWERPCLIQIYDTATEPAVAQDAGMRVTGGASRIITQKSFNIYFRDDYGADHLDYPLFDGIDSYRSFRLRAGGNNAEYLKFKDAMLMELASGCACTTAESRKAVVFLNGEYWGPYLLSEKIDADMLSDHYGVDPDQVVFMKDGELEDGEDEDIALYEELMSYADRDLADPATWDEFCSVVDIQSFADYSAVRIYLGDADWKLDSNDLLWRTRDTSFNDGKWQYILYDIEFSTGMYTDPRAAVETDHLQMAFENYPLFAAAMKNPEFCDLFLSSLKRVGSENFSPDRVDAVLQSYLAEWEPLMSDYRKRFGDNRERWGWTQKMMVDFIARRYDIIVPIVEAYAQQLPR